VEKLLSRIRRWLAIDELFNGIATPVSFDPQYETDILVVVGDSNTIMRGL